MNSFRILTLFVTRYRGLAVIFGFTALLVLSLLLARSNVMGAAHAASSPTIASDQADYSPGATVTLTGAGWASGEAVHIFANDSVGNTWSLNSNPDPVADGSGGFTYRFSLPSDFIANYSVTATGPTSGTATTTFTDSNCPSLSGKVASPLVGASFFTSGVNTLTYTFSSATGISSTSQGVPGLIDYCVYPTGSSPLLPDSDTVQAIGANGSHWVYDTGTDNFSYHRPSGGGDNDNIPLDGTTVTMGTATWSGNVPTSQTILLHINDTSECTRLYGSGSTCFVLPGLQHAKDLTVSKTATASFTRTYKWGIQKSVDKTEIDIADGTNGNSATFNYTVSVSHDSGTDSNWQVTGTITINNPNGFDFTGVNVTDDGVNNGGSCSVTNGTNLTVPKNGSIQVSYTCTYSSAPSPSKGTNTATVIWDGTKYNTPDSSASGRADFDFGSVSPKLVDNCVSVTDPLGGNLGKVCVGDANPTTFIYSYKVTGKAGTCVTQDNTATFTTNTNSTTGSASQTVKVCVGVDLTVSKTATPSFTRTYNWKITKNVDKPMIDIANGNSATFNYSVTVSETGFTDSGWQVKGTITVSNPNNWEAITADVSDVVNNGGSCTVSGVTGVSVPASGSVKLDYTCIYASEPSSSSGTNTATATWDKAAFFTPHGSASGSVGFAFSTPTTRVNQTSTVMDSYAGPLGSATATDSAPFTSQTFSYSRTESGTAGTCTTYDNTATILETGQTAGQTVKVCVGVDLTVSKSATPSFTRTYNWSIAKSVDKALVEQIGGTTTFNYSVTVSETGFTDSDWQVNGTITITNPNDWEAITLTNVVIDTVDNGGSCTVSAPPIVTIDASSKVTLPYSCTYSSVPNPSSGINTATASWDKAAAFTPDGSAQGTANFAFSTPTKKVNQTITVQDTFNGVTTTLGTLTATDAKPFASAAYTYSHTVNVPQFNCVKYTNTAVIVETGQSASKTVEVCGPAQTGALTMGFWQNKNGQGIISAANQGALGTWLRQYHPFSDAPSTGLATYVYNIIKAANCSGTTCNSMLRAQMLATALDVYFSDPALGGNKISAPAPIGGKAIDLTKVCTDIPTCTSFVNVSSAFGGATSLTVSQMLSYQNTADPAADAGAVWYSNVKATQVLAKDAFDAINNQVAFAP